MIELKKVFKYRNIWMALAILWTVFYHYNFATSNIITSNIRRFGFAGVDIFIFASGLGCYFSLAKDSNILNFMKKRFFKLIPTYWCFLIFYFIFVFISNPIPVSAVIGNIFCIQNFTGLGNDFNWYISAIWLLYFLAPYFMILVEKTNSWKKFLGIIILLVVFSFAFWNSDVLIITVTRIPIFFIGMYMAKKANKDNEILNKCKIFLLISLMLLGIIILLCFYKFFPTLLWNYGLHWYPFILIIPGLCLTISLISQTIEKYKVGTFLLKVLEIIGSYTFEIYLVHALILYIFKYLISNNILIDNNIIWSIALLLIPLGCIILKIFTKFTVSIFTKTKKSQEGA